MARLGLIQRVTGLLYRDLETGKFISYAEAKPIIEQARYNSYLRRNISGSFAKAERTLSELYGLGNDEARRLIADYRTRYRTWQDEGREGEMPTLESPQLE